jgi:hypothetical protein
MAERILARSQRYVISHEYEVAFLHGVGSKAVIIGDFYGDPACAVIDYAERWCIIAGCGLILYYLNAPFQPYGYDSSTAQWVEWGRAKPDVLWVEAIYQVDADYVRFVVDPYDEKAGIYQLCIPDQRIVRLVPP